MHLVACRRSFFPISLDDPTYSNSKSWDAAGKTLDMPGKAQEIIANGS